MAYTKSNTKSPARAITPTPANATQELHNATVEAYTRHFASILTPELLIAHRTGCYATVINGTQAGLKLEAILGTDNAKLATEEILNNITASIAVVPIK